MKFEKDVTKHKTIVEIRDKKNIINISSIYFISWNKYFLIFTITTQINE